MVSLRPMEVGDLTAAQALTASFGWPHRRDDWAAMLALGQGVVAERDGHLAGTCLCWRFGAGWATMGLIAVAAALHGQGTGRGMMADLMDRLEGRNLALHATRAGLKLYGAMGFEPTGTVVQHQGAPSQPGLLALRPGERLRPLTRADVADAVALDCIACGMDRTDLLATLTELPGGIALDRGGDLAGFALVRRFGHGQVIGPVVAPEAEGAKAMIAHLLGQRTGQFMRIDLPRQAGLGSWLEGLGLANVGTVIRMVRGQDGPPGRVRTFGLASQAYG